MEDFTIVEAPKQKTDKRVRASFYCTKPENYPPHILLRKNKEIGAEGANDMRHARSRQWGFVCLFREILEYNGSSWDYSSGGGTLLNTDFNGLSTKKLTAVHFPVAADVTYADSKFSFTSGGKPVYTYFLYQKEKDYTVEGTTVKANLSLGKPANMVQFHVAGIPENNVADYTFGCSKIQPFTCKSVGTDGSVTGHHLEGATA